MRMHNVDLQGCRPREILWRAKLVGRIAQTHQTAAVAFGVSAAADPANLAQAVDALSGPRARASSRIVAPA